MHSDSLVIIPTYNEIENIDLILKAVFNLDKKFHVLVVDDNSPDGTGARVKELQNSYKDILFLEERAKKEGLGAAYVHGFKWALSKSYDYIFEMDADFSHNPKDLKRLYDACHIKGADISIGSRYVKGVNVVNWSFYRVLLSYGASFYVKLITGMRIHDPTAGFICYKRHVIEAIKLDKVRFVGYAFQIEMKYRAHLRKFKLLEVPVVFTDRVRGVSKLNGSIIKEAAFGVLRMRLSSIFNKKKF